MPLAVQRDVHARLHELARTCRPKAADKAALGRTTTAFTRYYKRYPSRRFRMQIDDEQGTTLSALLVLRHALRRCSPRLARQVDETLPADITKGLPALE